MLPSSIPSIPIGACASWGRRGAAVLTAVLLWAVLAVGPSLGQARVQVIHNSPDPRASTVDVYLDSTRIIDDLNFRGAFGYTDIPAGTQTIGIAPGTSSSAEDIIYTQDVTLQDGQAYVAVATGELGLNGVGDGDFQLLLKGDARESGTSPSGDVEFFGVHGSPDAPTVDVQTNDKSKTLLSGISYPGVQPSTGSGYNTAQPGVVTLDVNVSSSGATAATFEADLSGFTDQAVTVLASGYLSPEDETEGSAGFSTTPEGFGLIAADANGNVVSFTPVTRTQIVHNSPDPRAESVDVYLNDTRVVDDLTFRDATGYINVPVGTQTIGIAPGNTSAVTDTVYSQDVTFVTGKDYVALATGELGSPGAGDFQLLAKTDAREFPASEDGDVEFFGVHGSPDAPTVDVQTNDGSTTLLSGISYPGLQPGNGSGYGAAPPAEYTLDVNVSANDSTAATFAADLTGFDDQALTLLASGYLTPGDQGFGSTPEGFGLLAVDRNGNVVPLTPVTRTQIVHNSPDPRADTVDVYLNGTRVVDDLGFRDATGYINVPAGTQTIGIAPGNSTAASDTIYAQDIPFVTGKDYVALATGELGSPGAGDFQLLAKTDAREFPASEDGDVEFFGVHGSPDAPTVDVQTNDGSTTLLSGISYPGIQPISGYSGAPPAEYTLDVNVSATDSTAATFAADLTGFGDQALTLLASGYLTPGDQGFGSTPEGFGLLAVDRNGNVVPLTPVARAQIIHNSGDPDAEVVDIYVDNESEPFVDDLEFRDATGFVNVPAGTREIDVAPGGSSGPGDAVATQNVTFETGMTYTAVANGVLDTTQFQSNPSGADASFGLDVATGALESVSTTGDGTVPVRVAHGATDAPTVDVLANGNVFVNDATYPAITGYQDAPASALTLEVTPGGSTTTLYAYEVDLSPFDDTPLTVIASGFNTIDDESGGLIPPFTLLGVAPDGTVLNLGSDVVISEFLADVGSLDANGDGSADSGDQFVELLNVSTTDTLDLSGYTISTSDGSYTLPDESGTTLAPGKGLVVFNDGSPTGIGAFADTGLPAINSGGDEIVLADASGGTLQSVQFGGGSSSSNAKSLADTGVPVQAGESTARNGANDFVPHTSISGNSVAESAGENNLTGATLPVELADFSARLDGSTAVLTWRTLSEQNNSGFAIQRRTGDSSFEQVGFREGQGTTSEATSYRFRVSDLEPGRHAFRLKQVDLDGAATFTESVNVRVELDAPYAWTKVAPNPVTSTGTITLQVRESQEVRVELFDLLGRRVRTLHNGTLSSDSRHQMQIDGTGLSNGAYLLRVEGETFSDTQRITVVK